MRQNRLIFSALVVFGCAALPLASAQDDGDLPDSPHTLTAENQVQYANLVLQDLRPIDPDNAHNNPYTCFKKLRLQDKMTLKFTWDQSVLEEITTNRPLLLAGLLDDICGDIVTWLGSNQGAYFKGPLSKVKELHLTTTPKPRTNNDGAGLNGYYLSYNKAAGVLTAAMSTKDGTSAVSNNGGSPFGEWITKNVK